MSYDINFWKQERSLDLSPEEIYGELCEERTVDGLATLPVDEILGQLRAAYPDFDPSEDFPGISSDEWSMEVTWSDQHFRFDLRGEVPAADQNRLIEMMAAHGCPMYDPQQDVRYDTEGGTALGELPVMTDPTPEELAEFERLKEQMYAQFDQSQKRGCGGSAALLVLGAVGVAGWFWV